MRRAALIALLALAACGGAPTPFALTAADNDPDALAQAAAAVLGRALGVARAGYGLFYGRTPSIMVGTAHSNNGVNVQTITFRGASGGYRLARAPVQQLEQLGFVERDRRALGGAPRAVSIR